MADILYVYAEGRDFAAIEAEAVARLRSLAFAHAWTFFAPRVVSQRRVGGWDLGIELAFEAVDAAELPSGWRDDVDATLDCVGALTEALGVSFVLGLAVAGQPVEDLLEASSDRAEIRRAVYEIVCRPSIPAGWPRRTVRFDVEEGRPVVAIADYRVALGPVATLVFSLADGERSIADILQATARSRQPGLPDDPTALVLDALRSLVRDGFVAVSALPSPLPPYLLDAASEGAGGELDATMRRDGFDPSFDPRRRER